MAASAAVRLVFVWGKGGGGGICAKGIIPEAAEVYPDAGRCRCQEVAKFALIAAGIGLELTVSKSSS